MSETHEWQRVADGLPPVGEEVLVWIDGHRGPAWRNNHALVAYRESNGGWYQERHREAPPLVGVIYWKYIDIPEAER
jgi:hypothetical protein